MSIGVIVQARMGSTRLPGKVLKPIAGRPLLDHVLGRLAMMTSPVVVVVATTDLPQDDTIVRHCLARGVPVFRGSETDVLDRYYRCSRENGFEHVVRLTADNPFTDIDELRRLIEQHLDSGNDYTHSFGSLPLGVGAEIFTFAALEISAQEGHAPNHREHVNEYIQEHPETFRIGVLEVGAAKQRPDLRLTVDTEADYLRACTIAGAATERWIGTEEAIRLCLRSA
ncbi:MAG: glycosyltransferase family protein [Pseudomonadota bacterium]